jgi:hypothetical protein
MSKVIIQNYLNIINALKQQISINKQNMDNILNEKDLKIKNLEDIIKLKESEFELLNNKFKLKEDKVELLNDKLKSKGSEMIKSDSDIIAEQLKQSNISFKKAGPFIMLT